MTDEQKKRRNDYQKEYKRNMTDEQKQNLKDYRKEYYKKYYAEKKLNNKIIQHDDDNNNDNDKNYIITENICGVMVIIKGIIIL